MKTIEIDWDIHKTIEAERRGFDEPPYVALRRLLSLPDQGKQEVSKTMENGLPWSEDGVILPHGSEIRMSYQYGKQNFFGRVSNGMLVVDGESYATLSQAACSLATTRAGGKTNLNGWNYWEARFPKESDWRSLKLMRENNRKAK